jgi:acetoin utilization protein AcuB
MKKTVKDYMTALPQTIGADSSLHLAKILMDENSCHHLPVLDGGELVGVISLFDLSLVLLTSKAKSSKISDVMTTSPYTVPPDTSLKKVATEMLEQKISSVIVQAQGSQPWGIFTNTDALRIVAETQ